MAKSWREAIELVLTESGKPMHYREIADQVLSKGYYQTDGATPNDTVNAQITRSIKHQGASSRFIRIAKGVYGLREMWGSVESDDETATKVVEGSQNVEKPAEAAAIDPDSDESVIRCLGMYWKRELIVWKGEPRIFGKQQALAKAVDFSRQRGIYILYDHHTVMYVGRSVDRPLGRRLYEHTIDRLNSRWDRFSWFGLLDVANDGSLVDVALRVSTPSLIATLEALLIETLEPPQNRKRGDDFSVVEFIQEIDPELREQEIKRTLRAIEQNMRSDGN